MASEQLLPKSYAERSSLRAALPQLRQMGVLTAASMLQNCIDFLRPLIFNLFVSANLQRSTCSDERKAHTMDCVSLGSMTINIVVFASAMGFNTGIDAYAPMAFGERNMGELHRVLYRQAALLGILLVLLLILLWNMTSVLVYVGLAEERAQGVGEVLRLLLLAVPGDLMYDVLGRWAKSMQKHTLVSMCVFCGLLVSLAVNVLGSRMIGESSLICDEDAFVQMEPVSWPVRALILQNTALPLLVLGALWASGHQWVKVQPRELLTGLWAQLRTSLQAMVWTCTELWAWELQVFEAAALGPGGAAGYTILSMTYSLLIMLGMGVTPALTAMMGEVMGEGDFLRGMALLKLGSVIGFVSLSAVGLLLLSVRGAWASHFSGGVPAVFHDVYTMIPLIVFLQLADGLLNTLRSWLTVRKHQGFGAIQAIACYWGVAVPLGAYLCFKCALGIAGLYLGLGTAVLLILATSFRRVRQDFGSLVDAKSLADLEGEKTAPQAP